MNSQDTIIITIRSDLKTKERLQKKARSEYLSLSAYCKRAIDFYEEYHKQDTKRSDKK